MVIIDFFLVIEYRVVTRTNMNIELLWKNLSPLAKTAILGMLIVLLIMITQSVREMFDPKTMDTVAGKILKIEYYEGTTLMIYTDAKKPVLVALGPTGYFQGQQKVLKPGNKVTVTGSKVVVDDTPYLIATKIKEGNQEMQIRDKDGNPIWMGWKNPK